LETCLLTTAIFSDITAASGDYLWTGSLVQIVIRDPRGETPPVSLHRSSETRSRMRTYSDLNSFFVARTEALGMQP
jgi:hypothetical protein